MEKLKKYQAPETKDVILTMDRVIAASFEDGGEVITYDSYEEEDWI